MLIHIKNMVCPRCIESVTGIFRDLGVDIVSVNLGEVVIKSQIGKEKKASLSNRLIEKGFFLLEDRKSQLITSIKSIIINQIHHMDEPMTVNFSTFLSSQLNQEYSSLSKLFSSVEGITIERYITRQKIERVKEMLFYKDATLSEIALDMNYSSSAYLASQFKKETGMTPSEFRQMKRMERKSIDSI